MACKMSRWRQAKLTQLAAAALAACGNASSPDAGVDATGPDAARDATVDGEPPYPECDVGFGDLPWLRIREEGNERTETEYSMIVVESTEMQLRAEAGGLPADPIDPFFQLDFPFALGAEHQLPGVGDEVFVVGGACDHKQDIYYLRVMDADRRLLFEGGSPECASAPDGPENPHLGGRDRPGAEPCSEVLTQCCCRDRTEHDVILHADGDSLLVRGEDRVVEIDGARFLASSQGLFLLEVTPCTRLHSAVKGSAFVVRLADGL